MLTTREKPTTRVSIRGFPDAYVGRASSVPYSLLDKLGADGFYGNPHIVGFCQVCKCEHARGEAVAAFRKDFLSVIKTVEWYRESIEELRGLRIACHCNLDQDCHGDVYLEYLNSPK